MEYWSVIYSNTTTVYHENFEAEKFRGFLVLRETFFHENISVAIEKRALIAITMGIHESFFVKITDRKGFMPRNFHGIRYVIQLGHSAVFICSTDSIQPHLVFSSNMNIYSQFTVGGYVALSDDHCSHILVNLLALLHTYTHTYIHTHTHTHTHIHTHTHTHKSLWLPFSSGRYS